MTDFAIDEIKSTVLRDRPDQPKTAIQTFTGQTIDLTDPAHGDILIEDIAHGLAHTCRFGAQCQRFYSVAEHAVLCLDLVRLAGGSLTERRAALHHDDHEAYIGDVPSPMKPVLGHAWEHLELRWQWAIARAFDLPTSAFASDAVRWADFTAVTIEAAELMPSAGWDWARASRFTIDVPWRGGLPPDDAKALYIDRVRRA